MCVCVFTGNEITFFFFLFRKRYQRIEFKVNCRVASQSFYTVVVVVVASATIFAILYDLCAFDARI